MTDGPGDIAWAVVIPLKRQLDVLHIHRALHPCPIQGVPQFLHAALDGVVRVSDAVWHMRITSIIPALSRLHGIESSATRLLHHDGFDQLHIFRDTVLRGVQPDSRLVSLHLGADGKDGGGVVPSGHVQQSSKQHNQQNNHSGKPCSSHGKNRDH